MVTEKAITISKKGLTIMIKIGSTLTTHRRLSLIEHLLYRLRLQKGGIFLIKTPEMNGRSFLIKYLEKNLSTYEIVFSATKNSKSLFSWIGRYFKISSPTIKDIKREFSPIHLSGRNIILLVERINFFDQDFLQNINDLLEEMPFIKIVITGSTKELSEIKNKKSLFLKIKSRENWPPLSFASSLEFLDTYYSKLPAKSKFLVAFTSHGKPGILKKLAEHVLIFKKHLTRRTIQVILKNYSLTFPFFPKNLGFFILLLAIGTIGYFTFNPILKDWKTHKLDIAKQVLEQSTQKEALDIKKK
ncbi:MAG: hypothetical protein ACTSXL_05195 [Alphaproteobacteria bacterium]